MSCVETICVDCGWIDYKYCLTVTCPDCGGETQTHFDEHPDEHKGLDAFKR